MSKSWLALFAGMFLFSGLVFSSPKPGAFITSGPLHDKRLALTFDDGPGPDTEKFFALFERYHVHVTFFVLGELAGYHPEIVKKAQDQGHEIGSHTYNHINYKAKYKEVLSELSAQGKGEKEAVAETQKILLADMKKSDALIEKAIGHKITFCRMPNGIDRPWIKDVAREMGYTLVNWTYGADWTPQTYDQLLPGYLKAIKPGAILLLHDGGKNRSKTLALTEAIIKEAQKQDFKIVTVGELLSDK